MSKRTIVAALTLLVTFALAVSAFAQDAKKTDKAPKLTIVEPLKDFGTVAKGTRLEWAFEVKNTGNADLEILSASPTCGCTVAHFDKVIKPGQSGKVTAGLDTNLAGMGPTSKHVTIQTNDPNTPTAQLTLNLIVKPYVDAHPAGFVRYSMLQGDAQTQSLTLFSEEEEPFEIVKIEPPGDYVKVNHRKIENDLERAPSGSPTQNQYKLNITLGGPTAQIGPLAEKIKIVTNSKHQPEFFVTLTGVIRPTYNVIPSILNFGEIAPADAAATRTVILQSNNKQAPGDFKVTKVETSGKSLLAEAKPTDTPGMYEVTISVGAEASGEIEGNVMIYTSDSMKPVYTLPVKGTIKKPTT